MLLRNTLISDEWRQHVLDYHNRIRRTVAEGKQKTGAAGKFMPKADKMYYLNWDCDMEYNAFLSSCGGSVAIPRVNGVNKADIQTNKKCNIKDDTTTILRSWWDQATAADLSQNIQYNENLQKEFGNMVHAVSSGFACSYSNCAGNTGELLCLYSSSQLRVKAGGQKQ
ncbi:hypothetical protein ANCCEY_09856 [Ancylostoma ceylanicum]|uniref:SCP domain-containing protein n=1 Tax=Ancylostoma ceylanicum TaxID=53326 RepID=A0A0D6LGG3_9BILA|nr:hypothetical protein ANCCEY_09856 [Ancylostoma ceylanicum]